MLSPQLADDADEELYFFLESIERVEISARRYRLFGHPDRFLFIEGGWGDGAMTTPNSATSIPKLTRTLKRALYANAGRRCGVPSARRARRPLRTALRHR